VLDAFQMQRPRPGRDEEHLLPALVASLGRAAGREADHPLLELLAAARGVDRGPHLGCITGRAHAHDVLLRDNEALCDRHAGIVQG
jgi:hypothetical protein